MKIDDFVGTRLKSKTVAVTGQDKITIQLFAVKQGFAVCGVHLDYIFYSRRFDKKKAAMDYFNSCGSLNNE